MHAFLSSPSIIGPITFRRCLGAAITHVYSFNAIPMALHSSHWKQSERRGVLWTALNISCGPRTPVPVVLHFTNCQDETKAQVYRVD